MQLEVESIRGGRASKSSSIERTRACGIPQSSGTERARASDGQAHSSSSEYQASDLEFFFTLLIIRIKKQTYDLLKLGIFS